MLENSPSALVQEIRSQITKYESIIAQAGIRYGSVAYIAFGERRDVTRSTQSSLTSYSAEIEFGADHWVLYSRDQKLVSADSWDGSFAEAELVRDILEKSLIGKKVTAIECNETEFTIEIKPNLVWKSRICSSPKPASGFLLSFSWDHDSVWETLDGQTKLHEL